ncbi:MAG: hypothetical protein ACKO7D_06830 [Bacteroidota bacterium]
MRIVIALHIVLISFISFSQKPQLYVSKNPVIVGEPFEISIKVESTQSVVLSSKWDSLLFRMKNDKGIFELTPDKFEISSFQEAKKSTNNWGGTFKAIVWDSGTFVFPSLKINSESKTLITDSLLIECQLEKKIEGVDLYEIRESFIDVKDAEKKANEEKVKSKKWIYLIIVLSVFFVLAIIFFFLRKVRNKKKEVSLRELTLAERAILAIDELEKLQLWNKERHKDHFVELSFILRSYYSSLYQLNLLEKTTSETQLLLQQVGLSTLHLKQIDFVLKHADLVKFAGSVLEENYVLALDEKARECVRLTTKD